MATSSTNEEGQATAQGGLVVGLALADFSYRSAESARRSRQTGPDRTGPDRTGPDRTGPDQARAVPSLVHMQREPFQ